MQKKIFSMLVLFSLILFTSSCVSVFNNPPNAPANPYPEDNATDVSTDLSLRWSCSDPDGDSLTYDIYFGTDLNNLQLVAQNYSTNSYQISNLEYNKKYYWKIVAKDSKGAIREGTVWSFTTVDTSKCTITLVSKTITVGRVGYVQAKVLNSADEPVKDIDVAFEYYDGTWKQLSTVKTNSYGIASQELSYDFHTQEGKLLFRAYIKDQPAISAQESISFQKPSWVFLIYLAADNNLEQYALIDLEEMKNSNSAVAIFALFDGKSSADALLTLDEYGEYKYIETYQQDINSGDPEVLRNFIERFSNITSIYRGLIIWNHGSAWLSDSDYTTKAIGFDDTQNDALSICEIRQVLGTYPELDILGMDACLMGSAE
ncbi:MAG TPA: clostripain-related cysteine peptidase, partial [Pseudothermotoga sp.]|nr:clostripain-related cysteine peptidase [Pseudothermotoga sp.]